MGDSSSQEITQRLLAWRGADLIAPDDALEALAAVDQRKSEIVMMRFFGGLTVAETAAVLKVSPDTVMRDWHLAKIWLFRALSKEGADGA